MPQLLDPAPPLQVHLGQYLQFEMRSRQQTPECLNHSSGLCPVLLHANLRGHIALTPSLTFTLAQLWDLSPGMLWHWQQDILHAPPSVQTE